MVGRVGYDLFADHLKASLAAAGVDVSAVAAVRSEATGVAFIGVDDAGQNSIVVASGANGVFPAADVEGSRASFRECEVRAVSVGDATRYGRGGACGWRGAKARRRFSILRRPSCCRAIAVRSRHPHSERVRGLHSARASCGTRDRWRRRPALAQDVLAMGPAAVILKLGENGCLYVDPQQRDSRARISS